MQPVLTAWLVVAMLLPAFLGLAPGAQASPAERMLQLSELQLCAKLGHLPDDSGTVPKGHTAHDCPCCLPTFAGFAALPPHDPALVPAALWHQEKLALTEFTLRLFARQPHRTAPARAPPSAWPA